MGRITKSIKDQKGHLTKDEIQTREQVENILQGSKDLIYQAPEDIPEEVADLYNHLVELLKPMDILTDCDQEVLTLCATSIVNMRKAQKTIDELGQVIVIHDQEGNIVKVSKNSAIDVLMNYEKIFNRCAVQLGLSVSSRAKLSYELSNAIRLQKQEEEKPTELTKEEIELKWLMA